MKPTEKEIKSFKKFLEGKGFIQDNMDRNVYYLYTKYGYICLFIEYTKKFEFKDVRAFLSIEWGKDSISNFHFPGYHELGKAVKSLDRDYIERCVRGSDEVEAAIGKLLENIPKILHNTIGR